MWWTPDRIKWYERAAERCTFHRDLVKVIERHLNEGESILELGCGLGRASALLSRSHPIHAVDIDKAAIDTAMKREKADIYSVMDWKDLKETADCVLCIFFGHLDRLELLPLQMNMAKRHAVFIYSEHRGQKDDLVLKETTPKEEMERKLNALGYGVESESFTLSFPQPLLSLEEAEEFIALSYPKKSICDYLPFVTKSGDRDYPYVLKNEKKMLLFDISKQSVGSF